MKLRWTSKALDDLSQLHVFLHPANSEAAAKAVQALTRAADQLSQYPRLGERLEQFASNEIRRIFVGNYEIRYEIREAVIYIARLWHTRENR
jgi:plasmid stabilization system protein ParE